MHRTDCAHVCLRKNTDPTIKHVKTETNISVDVAASSEGGPHRLDDAAEDCLQVALEHPMQLVALSCRQPQRTVAVLHYTRRT